MGHPRTADGKQIVLQAKYRGDWERWFPSAGDDPVNGKGRGPFPGLQRSSAGEEVYEFQWDDPVYIGGGTAQVKGGEFGDWVAFEFYAPATNLVSSVGGAVKVVDGKIVPADGDGTDNLGPTVVPIPVGEGNGDWEYEQPETGTGTVSAGGKKDHILLTTAKTLTDYVPPTGLLGDHSLDMRIPSNPKKMYPQWKGKITLHNENGSHTVAIVWKFETARKVTT